MRLSACVGAVAWLAIGAWSAHADVTAKLDLDGDGTVDTLLLTRGRLWVEGQPGFGELRLPAGGSEGLAVRSRQAGLVVVETGGTLALVGARHRLEILWQGPSVLGEGDYRQGLDLADEGVLRYVIAPFARCDDTPARWLLHGWDPGARKFRPAAVTRGTGTALAARPIATPPGSIGWSWIGASSRQGATSPEAIGAPTELGDGKPDTAWRPSGDGRGASVIARGLRVGVSSLELVAAAGTRLPRVVNVVLRPGARFTFSRGDDARAVRLWLPAPVDTDCVELEVVEPSGPVALAELRNRRIGFVFQFHHLLREFSALENVMMPLRIGGWGDGEARSRAEQLLAEVGLAGRMTHRPAALSGGEQQRCAVARALVRDPGLLLADEPTGNLDHSNSAMVADLFFRLARELETAVIIVTHNRQLALRADRMLVLDDGRLSPVREVEALP